MIHDWKFCSKTLSQSPSPTIPVRGLNHPRRGPARAPSAGLAGAGVALGFAFFFFNEVCGALGRSGIIPTVAAAWTPPAIALLSGLTLLCYTEDG